MEVQKDFADLCVLLNASGLEYLIVGGYALAFHGAPRFTGGLDFFVRPASENVGKLQSALRALGFDQTVPPAHLLEDRRILQL